jgi:flagellar biosynthesis protein
MLESKPEKKAIALGYEEDKNEAPQILAKGSGEVAEEIIAIGKENKIMIREDEALLNSLEKLEVGEQIPAQLYQIVAELLAYVYKVEKKYQRMIV